MAYIQDQTLCSVKSDLRQHCLEQPIFLPIVLKEKKRQGHLIQKEKGDFQS